MKTKHTPEPWMIDFDYIEGKPLIRGLTQKESDGFSKDYWGHVALCDGDNQSVLANANVIAAAPALLRKAKEVVSRGYLDFELINIIRAAEGKSNE